MALPERMNPSHSHPEPPDEGSSLPVLSASLSACPLSSSTTGFPAERYGGSGAIFEACVYSTDPTKPIGSIKEAWEAAKVRAGVKCRFHDLRHTAVSRMLDAGVPIAKVAKIVGWSPATMVRMAARYGHFALEELRSAVDSISRTEIQRGSPVFPPVTETAATSTRPN
jgi:integrase